MLIAVVAGVGFLARVEANVCFEVMISGKPFITNLTNIRLLSRVGSFMVLEDVLVTE